VQNEEPIKAAGKRQKARKPSRAASELRAVFGSNLRAVRHAKGLSIFDVSQAAEVDWSYLAQIERGERSVGLDVLHALAEAVETPLHELLNPASRFTDEDTLTRTELG
jgi:transcriptional regulator with XRE-family HTH domain